MNTNCFVRKEKVKDGVPRLFIYGKSGTQKGSEFKYNHEPNKEFWWRKEVSQKQITEANLPLCVWVKDQHKSLELFIFVNIFFVIL